MYYFLRKVFLFLIIGGSPLILLLLGYFIFDPFMVLRKYDDYSYSYVLPNRDYISTETYLRNYHSKKYNSFIFGSSRTLAFRPESWKDHLTKTSEPYIFDASGESIEGINKKIKLIDALGEKIENALIILCEDVSFQKSENHEGHLYIMHPKESGGSWLIFHWAFIKAYFNPTFLLSYYDFTITGDFKDYMTEFLERRKMVFDKVNNKMTIEDQEEELLKDPISYYKKRESIFYSRDTSQKTNSYPQINSKHKILLEEITEVLEKHNTNYYVVIGPLYNQREFHPKDLGILRKFFNDRLYDFSGVNSFTMKKTNYYENSHYRPEVGDSIMNYIYNK
jgi:hypothetical protein